jgi:peptidoglycan/LPS O-acetylase OafA/YrhL
VVTPTGDSTRTASGGRLVFLDGLRAFAVVAVLLFHAGVAGVDGGLLGVDVFFVLSGFLITSLLCGEYLTTGAIRLGHFWAARARRLLPALFLLLLGVALYAWFFRQSVDVSSIRGDAIATLLYVANWHFIFSSQGYFAQSTTPSPLLHMWSLGVEEQFYVIWPLVTVFVLHRAGRRAAPGGGGGGGGGGGQGRSGGAAGPRAVALVAAVGAAASALLMAVLSLTGASINRLYYGTDTRAQALLVGAALGALASRREWRVVAADWAARPVGRLTGLLLGGAGSAFLLWAWHDLNGQSAFLYQGGFLLVALAAGAVITTVTSWRSSVLATICSLRPLVYIGRISYGLYVYHWPLFLVLNHAHTGLSGNALLAERLTATLAAAAVCFRFVEQPIRAAALTRNWRGLPLAAGGALSTAVLVVVATIPAAAAATPVVPTAPSFGLSASEHQALAAAHAFTTDPVRFLMLGDSVAVTASVGLQMDSIRRDGVVLDDKGVLGCDLDVGPSLLGGVVYTGRPGVNCGSWPTLWSQDVAQARPEVVGLLLGRFEFADHFHNGQWVSVGQPAWDAHLTDELDQAVTVLSAHGAHVVIFTYPYIDPPLEQANGSIYPENDPARVVAWNALLRAVAASHPKTVTLIDLNRILDPAGHFTTTVDGVSVRWPDDGIHISLAGGEWLQPQILPEIASLGLQVRVNRPASGSH